MRVDFREGAVPIGLVVSRRNLLALLTKLDGAPEDSACTLLAPDQYGFFYLKAEEDADHYFHQDREAQGEAGVMHPDTEAGMSEGAGATGPVRPIKLIGLRAGGAGPSKPLPRYG